MQIREYSLPTGWFPHDSSSVSRFLSEFSDSSASFAKASFRKASFAKAAISPHAGWYYCGRIAARAVSSLNPKAETLVVLGGHLAQNSPPLFAMEDVVRTPYGYMQIDSEFRSLLQEKIGGVEDRYRDNTIEVLLPMAHFFFPNANIIWLRLPAEKQSFEIGKILSSAAAQLNRKINVLVSADLTHYGSNYGFTPKGTGISALNWVRKENDANFIKAVESGNCGEVLRRAESDFACCSAGAVLAAMGFAEAEGLENAKLLEYGTSADVDKQMPPDSFVGYAAMAFFEKMRP